MKTLDFSILRREPCSCLVAGINYKLYLKKYIYLILFDSINFTILAHQTKFALRQLKNVGCFFITRRVTE